MKTRMNPLKNLQTIFFYEAYLYSSRTPGWVYTLAIVYFLLTCVVILGG